MAYLHTYLLNDPGTFGTGLTFAPTKYNIVSIDDHNHDGTRKTHRTQLEY